jgi:hypothetical protein
MREHPSSIRDSIEADPGRCLHDMLPGQCANCRGHKLPSEVDGRRRLIEHPVHVDVVVDRTFRAHFEGRCALEPHDPAHAIEPNDVIGVTDVGYVCRVCVASLA